MAFDFSAWQPLLLVMVFAGVGLLGLGFMLKGPHSHLLRAAGWVLFGLYWPFQAPSFFYARDPDPINGWFTLLGPIFLWWVAWHEWKSYQWKEDPPALRWFAGASAISAGTYFVVYEIQAATEWIIHVTAVQSAWLYNWVFYGGSTVATVQQFGGESHIFLPGGEYAVTVILACTAIQSIMIFVGAIVCLGGGGSGGSGGGGTSAMQKWKAIAVVAPTIWFLNLFRNAGIVYGYKVLDWGMFGIHSFEWMHSYVGKIGALVAMIIIALWVFSTLPQLHSNILDLFDLRKRKGPQTKPPGAAAIDLPAEN